MERRGMNPSKIENSVALKVKRARDAHKRRGEILKEYLTNLGATPEELARRWSAISAFLEQAKRENGVLVPDTTGSVLVPREEVERIVQELQEKS